MISSLCLSVISAQTLSVCREGNPVPTFPDRALGSPGRLQRLRRVDIEEGAKALDRDFRHRLAMPCDQMAGADVAVERHQLVEEAARPQYRIAAPAIADGHSDQIAAVGRKRFDQPIDQMKRL
jgi:hypothetical protein